MGQLKHLADVLTKNSASRKSALTMRGSTVRRTKIDESIIWCAGLPAGIEDLPCFFVFRVRLWGHSRKRARSMFRHLLTIKSTSCCQNRAAYIYFAPKNKHWYLTVFFVWLGCQMQKVCKTLLFTPLKKIPRSAVFCQTCEQNILQIVAVSSMF